MKMDFLGRVKTFVNLSSQVDIEAASANIRENVHFRGMNMFILACAIIIASVGLNLNSIPVIIGAMLISPLMGPILGFGLGLGTNDTALVRDALKNYVIMVGISILASTIYFLLSPLTPTRETELLARTNPTIYDVLIALFGGAAGMLENSRKDKGTVLAGVAIATALMPPLCTMGYGIAHLNLRFVGGAFYLFIINSIFIALATLAVVKYLGYPAAPSVDEARRKRSARAVSLIIIVLIIPSIFSATRIVRETNFDRHVDKLVEANKTMGHSYIFDYQVDHTERPAKVEIFMAGEALPDSEKLRFYAQAEELGIMRTQLSFHEDATLSPGSGLDAELMKDIFEDSNQRIEALLKTVSGLESELGEYKARELPAEILAMEIRAQYEEVTGVVVARGEASDSAYEAPKDEILVLVKCTEPLSGARRAQMEKWLKIRLKAENVTVITTMVPRSEAGEKAGAGENL